MLKHTTRALIVIAVLLPGRAMCLAGAGDLDPTFGDGGLVTTTFFGPATDIAQDVAIACQADGKIVVAGTTQFAGGFDFALARYNADGTLDSSFGSGGLVTTNFGSVINRAFSVAIQADGKIVAAGFSFQRPTSFDFALARYNADGTLDSSFGAGGLVTTDFGSGANGQ